MQARWVNSWFFLVITFQKSESVPCIFSRWPVEVFLQECCYDLMGFHTFCELTCLQVVKALRWALCALGRTRVLQLPDFPGSETSCPLTWNHPVFQEAPMSLRGGWCLETTVLLLEVLTTTRLACLMNRIRNQKGTINSSSYF